MSKIAALAAAFDRRPAPVAVKPIIVPDVPRFAANAGTLVCRLDMMTPEWIAEFKGMYLCYSTAELAVKYGKRKTTIIGWINQVFPDER